MSATVAILAILAGILAGMVTEYLKDWIEDTFPGYPTLNKLMFFLGLLLLVETPLILWEVSDGRGPATGQPAPTSVQFDVRVQAQDTGEGISGAHVIVDGPGGTVNAYADSSGLVRLFLDNTWQTQAARLIVDIEGYEHYEQNIVIQTDERPLSVRLVRE